MFSNLTIREFQIEDVNKIHELYTKFYRSYEYYNFHTDFQFACTVLDGDEVVAAGGIKPITELAAVCNKDMSPRKRREALLHILQTSIYACNRSGINKLHVFSQDPMFVRQLTSADFKLTGDSVLTLDV